MPDLRFSTLGFWIMAVLLAIVAATCAAQAPTPRAG